MDTVDTFGHFLRFISHCANKNDHNSGLNIISNFFLSSTRFEDPDPLFLGLPDPLLFSLTPYPTCNNGYIKLFSS